LLGTSKDVRRGRWLPCFKTCLSGRRSGRGILKQVVEHEMNQLGDLLALQGGMIAPSRVLAQLANALKPTP
jgi:hypothetical protein